MLPHISLIAAVARQGAIGAHNTLPWRLPEDMRHFRATTTGHPVIMGRKTFESLGRPLPERTNIIVSRDPALRLSGCLTTTSLNDAIALAGEAEEVFVIGGAQIYAQAIALANRLYLTEIELDVPQADAWFPEMDPLQWQEVSRESRFSETAGCHYHFVRYERQATE